MSWQFTGLIMRGDTGYTGYTGDTGRDGDKFNTSGTIDSYDDQEIGRAHV